MSLQRRFSEVITSHSKIVLVVSLLVVAAIGAGATAVDDDSSLEQFESDSPEVEAQEYIDENFTAADADNETTVQIITRGDDVLSQESLLHSLEFQQKLHANETINDTLAAEDPLVGVENIIATTAIITEEADQLEAEGDELDEEADRLEEEADRLEEEGDELEERGDELEERGAELAAEQAALEERAGILENAYEEVAPLYLQYQQGDDSARDEINQTLAAAANEADLTEEQNQTFHESAEITAIHEAFSELADNETEEAILQDGLEDVLVLQVEYEATADPDEQSAIEDEINQTIQNASADAGLDGFEHLVFEQLVHEFRADADGLTELPSIEELALGVFEEEFTDLEERGEELEADAAQLERDGNRLDQRADELEEWGDELEERGDELEQRGEELEDMDPSLDEQIDHLESMNESELASAIEDVLGENSDNTDGALGFMPTGYDPGSTEADARMMMVTQVSNSENGEELEGIDMGLIETQLDIRDIAQAHTADIDDEYMVFGAGIMFEEIDQSMGDSLAIVGPLALLFVVAALLIAYRDILDILLGLSGIVIVLLLTFGFMGWAGISFNQMFVAVPVLLIGLSIDYVIHVFMRHREQRANGNVDDTVSGSMAVALAGVGVALVWVTATAAIGFLANTVSPIEPIREFGIVSAFGIISALFVFGLLVPAAKVELDEVLERVGFDRRKRAFGTSGGYLTKALSAGAVAARRAPLGVLVLVVLLTAGGVYGASQVDTSFEEEDFLADEPPAWTQHLPEPFAPGEYHAKADLEFVNEHFQREDAQANILIQGNVTDPALLVSLNESEEAIAESDSAFIDASGDPDIEGPLQAMDRAATTNESFNESFQAADTSGDGVPDQDVESLYTELLEVDDQAAQVVYQTEDGDHEAVQLVIGIDGDAGFADTTDDMRAVAATIEGDGGEWTAVATGMPVVNHVVEQDLLDTVLESLGITLVAVFIFLSLAYWLTGKGAALGAVTLLPVAFTVSWILGSMYLMGMPFNVMTGMITSLTIGLGVAYSIHISSRYTLELDRTGNVWEAMDRTVTGTGGALLGSAATTVGGFGTLALAILPVLQQFGIITGLTIIYAFLASVIVLPTLLVLWTRYLGPSAVSFELNTPSGVAADGGEEEDDD